MADYNARSKRLNKALDEIAAVSLEIALDGGWVAPDVDEKFTQLVNTAHDCMVQAIRIVEGVELYWYYQEDDNGER